MSDNWISFVPSDPDWMPPTDDLIQQLEAIACSEFPDAEEVKAELHDRIMFVSPGANLETVQCPYCKSELMDWWQDEMDVTEHEGFTSLDRTVPCCGKATSLDALVYDWPAAFGRFQIDVMNPNVPDAPGAVLEAIEALAQTVFRVVRTHI